MVKISNKEKECLILHISNSEELEKEKITEVWRDETGLLCVKYENGNSNLYHSQRVRNFFGSFLMILFSFIFKL